jgi:hypothetical protein
MESELKENEENGTLIIKTNFQELRIPMQYMILNGELNITNNLNLGNTFPGKLIKMDILAKNSFNKTIEIYKITTTEKRFLIDRASKVIKGLKHTKIGEIIFDASKVVKHKNFMIDLKKQNKFVPTINKDDIDNYEWRYALYDTLKERKQLKITTQLTLHTNLLNKVHFNATCTLRLPKLLKIKVLDFGIIKIGKKKKMKINIKNNSDKLVLYSLLLGKKYGRVKHKDFYISNKKLNKIFKILPHSEATIGLI